MATTSSTGSSFAPTDFNFYNSFEDSSSGLTVAVERCPLCSETRRPFYCKSCVDKGNFIHSKATFPERYADKQLKWDVLKKERRKILERFTQVMEAQNTSSAKKDEISMHQYKVRILRQAVAQAKESLSKEKELQQALHDDIESRRTKAKKHVEKVLRICKYIKQVENTTTKQVEQLKTTYEELASVRKENIADLVNYIFPIREIQPKSDSDSVEDTISALAEARRTSYIRGRWVYTDNGGEHQYQVVEPTLPGNGDYTAYNLWIQANRESVPSSETDISQQNPAYNISAALCYTKQLTSIAAYFLDINLPKRLCYSEFCGNELSDKQFSNAVSKLNHHVLHLCFTQNVNPEQLHPKHTVHNLLMLLKSSSLGRSGAFHVNPELMLSIEESSQSDESDDEMLSMEDELGDLPTDWERVPTSLPQMEVPTHSSVTGMSTVQSQAHHVAATSVTPVNAGGLMSSAAASVASFWRAATGQQDKK